MNESVPTVYGDLRSGNCRKVRWALGAAEVEHVWQEVDILAGDTRTQAFLALNANGRVPLARWPDGRTLAESNAILWWFGRDAGWWPVDAVSQAEVLQWLFFEQYSHEPYIAVRRFIRLYLGNPPDRASEFAAREAGGYAALDVMEAHLGKGDWFVGEQLTLADVALFAYTSVAEDGAFDLSGYPAVRGWLARCAPLLPIPGDG